MTFSVFYCTFNKLSDLHLLVIVMDKRTHTITKESPSASLSLNHNLIDGQSNWSRCNSFSSSSNDSSLFCTSHLQSSSLSLGKRLASEAPSTRLPKRSRNSSGSSVSSNMSCISDKDTKKTPLIISSCVPNVSTHQSTIRTNVDGLSRLSCPDINTSAFELNHERLLKQHLSCSDASNPILPFRHNLRRNIRKKTCSCDCTATCTTVVVRRYNKIGKKTVKEETLISTKVETCSQNNSTQEVHNVSYEKSFSPGKTDSNRRRRSEVEKLYDSLHEIEWAKNFSPDNILRQLNIRQAASVSMFGNATKPKPPSELKTERNNKKRKDSNSDQATKSTYPKNQEESKKPKPEQLNHFVHRTRSKTRYLEQNSLSSDTKVNHSNESPVTNKLDVNRSHRHKKGKFTENCRQSSSSKSDCSESSIECTYDGLSKTIDIVPSMLQSPVLISENYLADYKNDSDEVPIPDITSDIKFFDIAEEGIRTIDACFREVGAEVVISTCYDVDSDLPRLTPVKDNSLSHKLPTQSDIPPVLERCVTIQEQKYSQVLECNGVRDTARKLIFKESINTKPSVLALNEDSSVTVRDVDNKPLEHLKCEKTKHTSSINKSANKILLLRAGKRILKKYLRYLHSRAKLQKLPSDKILAHSEESTMNHQGSESSTLDSTASSNSILNQNKIVLKKEISMSSVSTTPTFSFKSSELSCQNIGESSRNTTIVKTSNQKVSYSNSADGITFNHSKSNYVYATKKETNDTLTAVENVKRKTVILQGSTSSFSIRQPGTSTLLSIRDKPEDSERYEKSIPRPQKFNFACHYQSLRVYRYNGYSQVVLKLTRGNSIFLTIESLEELKDVMKKIGQDPQCHTFILMGCGRAFCSGLDLLPLLGPQKIKYSSEMAVAVKEFIETLSAFKKPIVVVVDGPAIGLGVTILTHADISIASDAATFCMPQSSLGYFPEGGATLTLPQAVGSTVAMDLILRSRSLTALEAKEVGLISEVVNTKDLGLDLVSRVKRLAENSLTCMETTKAMLKMRLHLELPMVLENEVKLLPQMWLSQPCQDALQSAMNSGLWIA